MNKNMRAAIPSQSDINRIRLLNDRLRHSRLVTVSLRRSGILQNLGAGRATKLTVDFESVEGRMHCDVTVAPETEQTSTVECQLPVGWSLVGVLHADWYLPQLSRLERTFVVPFPTDQVRPKSTHQKLPHALHGLSAASDESFDRELDAEFRWNRDFTKLCCELPYDETLEGATVRVRLQSLGMDRQKLSWSRVARLRKHGNENDPLLKCVVSLKKPSWSLDGEVHVFIDSITDNDFAELPPESEDEASSGELNVTQFLASQVFNVRVPKSGWTKVSVPNSWLHANSMTLQISKSADSGADGASLSSSQNVSGPNDSASGDTESLSDRFELFRTSATHEAFTEFWLLARPVVFQSLSGKARDKNLADELTQDTSIKLFHCIPRRKEPHANPVGYVLLAAINVYRSWLRIERKPLTNGRKRVLVHSEIADAASEVLTTQGGEDGDAEFSILTSPQNGGIVAKLSESEQQFVSLRKTSTSQQTIDKMHLTKNRFRDLDHRVLVKLRFLQAMQVCDVWRECGRDVYDRRHADAICRKVITGISWPQVVEMVMNESKVPLKKSTFRKSLTSATERIEHVAAGLWLQRKGFLQTEEMEWLRDWILCSRVPIDISSVLKDSEIACAATTALRLGSTMHAGYLIWQNIQADRKGPLKAAGRDVLLHRVLKNRSWDEALDAAASSSGKGNRRNEDRVALKERVREVWKNTASLVPERFRVLPE